MVDFMSRMIRAARLEVALYEEVQADRTALRQAMFVVLLSGLAAGAGSYWRMGSAGMFIYVLGDIVLWCLWAFLTYLIATKLLPQPQPGRKVAPEEMLRTIGFSSAPGILRVFGLIPGTSLPIDFVAWVWMLMAIIVAIKQVFDYTSIWQAVAVCTIGWVIVRIIRMFLLALVWGVGGGF